jgi:hypothetical protein
LYVKKISIFCFVQTINELTASAKLAAALEGAPPGAPGRGGARGAGVGALPGRDGMTGLLIVFGLAGTIGFGPGAGGVLLAAGTGAFALRASNSAFQAGTPLTAEAGAGAEIGVGAGTGGEMVLPILGGEGAALLAGGGGGGGEATGLGAMYSSR